MMAYLYWKLNATQTVFSQRDAMRTQAASDEEQSNWNRALLAEKLRGLIEHADGAEAGAMASVAAAAGGATAEAYRKRWRSTGRLYEEEARDLLIGKMERGEPARFAVQDADIGELPLGISGRRFFDFLLAESAARQGPVESVF